MKMNCLHCANLDLKTYPKHSALGWGRCKLDLPGVFRSVLFDQVCDKSSPAEESIVRARIEWAGKLNQKEK